ncbi:MAG: hypothetical protein QOE90_2401 [Thermoplasmata archaeon]|jgi:hypothetical protein|nr:hypothetical protein [Thermoplasmata archaeon]
MTSRSLSAFFLALLITLPALVLLTPTAAALPNGNDPWQQEIWRQAAPGSYSSSYTCGPCPSTGTTGTASLQPGDYYVVVNAGCNSCSGPFSYVLNGVGQVNWNNDGSVSLSSVGASVSAYQFLQWGGCSTGCYADLAVTISSAVTLSFNGFNSFGMASCGFGCSYGGGTLSTNALSGYGFVGGFWTGYSGAQNYHAMWFSAASQLSEAGILSTQMTRTPTTTQWTWTQVQGDVQLVNAANSNAGTLVSGVQSVTADLTKGAFIDTTAFRWAPSAVANGCSGATIQLAVSANMAYPWNVSAEIANLSFPVTQDANTGGTSFVTVDWSNALASSDRALTFGTPTISVAGSTLTKGTAAYYSNFPPSIAAGGTFYLHWNLLGTANCAAVMQYNGGNPYSGGSIYTDSGTAWTQQTVQDVNQLVMNVYGGTTILYTANEVQKDVGGASYLYVCEVQKDAQPQRYTLSTSYGGAARIGSYQAAGSSVCNGVTSTSQQQTIQEWRIGYESQVNVTQSVTLSLNVTGASRNLLYVGTLAGTQPTRPNVASGFGFAATGYNTITAYKLFSTNDYFANLTVQVRACALINADGSCGDSVTGTYGAPIPNGTYVGTVSSLRAFAGQWNASGYFSVSGQDVQGGAVAVTISASGYVTDSGVVINVPSAPGNYTVTLTLLPAAQGTGLSVKQSSVQVTFNVTAPQFVSGQVIAVSVNRTLNVDLWVILFQLDGNGNPLQARGFTPFDWTPSQTNQLDVAWPDGRTLNDADSGGYVLGVFIKATTTTKGVLVAQDPIGVNQAAPRVGTSLLTNLNVAGQNDISAQAQVNAAVTTGLVTEATVQQDFLTWLDWFPRVDFFLPNAVLYPVMFMVGALMLRFGRNGGR